MRSAARSCGRSVAGKSGAAAGADGATGAISVISLGGSGGAGASGGGVSSIGGSTASGVGGTSVGVSTSGVAGTVSSEGATGVAGCVVSGFGVVAATKAAYSSPEKTDTCDTSNGKGSALNPHPRINQPIKPTWPTAEMTVPGVRCTVLVP